MSTKKSHRAEKATKYNKYEFRQRNFPCHEKRRIETLNKGICDANLCTYKMSKAFHFASFFFAEEKKKIYLFNFCPVFICFSLAFHEITS